ncbi:uncharacterized protein MEPE_04599 [Melanopsichium pennsylvanicum]|uniref:Zn(2)-C6 fungal-type domain-containing protein n=2 Tax=Melanopsichium pennsylvanicum TaxID=63383 RepID=A0AAJ5C6I7_9BASI|nr:c6 transcription factor [Melanopsichium pennsylvanicum 4]SNX85890.1 uncharacterized protein MEPE_04599 [Melanopsichium pennsylvanicum]
MRPAHDQVVAPASSVHTPPKRSALACLPCRTAKNKCDGVPPPLIAKLSSHLDTKIPNPAGQHLQLRSEQSCTRCARLHLECIWQPSHRTGRPRKRACVQEASIGAPQLAPYNVHIASSTSVRDDIASETKDAAASSQHSTPFDQTTITMMDLLEHSQAQTQADNFFSESMCSFHLSESALISLLNQSPFDSSRAAIEQNDWSMTPEAQSQDFQSPIQTDQLITSLDEIFPPSSSPQPSLRHTLQDPTTQRVPALSPVGASSEARSQLSALRARLNPVSHSPLPTAPSPSIEASSSIIHLGEAKEALLCYIRRIHSDPSLDDNIDTAVLDFGCKLYFSSFAKTVPLLGDMTDFETTILNAFPRQNCATRLLRRIVATLGYRVSIANLVSEHDRNVLLQRLRIEARNLLSACFDRILTQPFVRLNDVEALALVQALLLFAYDSYGQNQLSEAESNMSAAVNLALKMRLNQIDAPSKPAGHDLNANHNNAFGARSALSQSHAESLRRAFWELYLCDLMLNVTTSGRIARCIDMSTLEIAVHTPLDPGLTTTLDGQSDALESDNFDTDRDRQALSQSYDVRVRSCALIHECVKPPENPDEPDFERIRAIDTMLSNIMVVAQRHWASASTANSIHSGDAVSECTRWANDTRIELLFTAMTMLHASRIHLHRLAWFHDLTMDFSSCSFKKFNEASNVAVGTTALRTSPGPVSQETLSRRQAMLSNSVTRIVSSADAIMRLIRLDQRLASPSTWTIEDTTETYVARRVAVHWPFLGCCNMVAAFGYVVAVAASNESNLPTYRDEIRLFDQHAPLFNTNYSSNVAFSHPSSPQYFPSLHTFPNNHPDPVLSTTPPPITTTNRSNTTHRNAIIWKIRAAISNILFAQSTLAHYAIIWPICTIYQNQVAMCRTAIDSTGPTGLQ